MLFEGEEVKKNKCKKCICICRSYMEGIYVWLKWMLGVEIVLNKRFLCFVMCL